MVSGRKFSRTLSTPPVLYMDLLGVSAMTDEVQAQANLVRHMWGRKSC